MPSWADNYDGGDSARGGTPVAAAQFSLCCAKSFRWFEPAGEVAVETAHEGRGHGVVDLPKGGDDVSGAGDMKARTKFATPSCPSIRPRLVSQADSFTRSAFNFIPVISRIWRRPSW